MTPIERAISRRVFYIDVIIIGCGITAYYAVRNGDIAAAVFIGAVVFLVSAAIANHVVHGRLRKRRSQQSSR